MRRAPRGAVSASQDPPLGRVIWELDQHGADDPAWIQMIATAAGCLVQIDGDAIHYVEHHRTARTNPPG